MVKAGVKVLVVDDDQAIRDFIRSALVDEGYEVITAEHGAIALALLEMAKPGTEPDLILLDMRMPVMDGWAFTKAFRESTLNQIPIVVLTAATDASLYAGQIQADNYLAKPFDLDKLISLVEHYAE